MNIIIDGLNMGLVNQLLLWMVVTAKISALVVLGYIVLAIIQLVDYH